MRALASNMKHRLASFKNSELATSIEAFSALGFHPGNDLVQVSLDDHPCGDFIRHHPSHGASSRRHPSRSRENLSTVTVEDTPATCLTYNGSMSLVLHTIAEHRRQQGACTMTSSLWIGN